MLLIFPIPIFSPRYYRIAHELYLNYSVLNLGHRLPFHPTEKPVSLYKWILSKYAKQGDKILDTHLGSGSIAIACLDMGFELTGCELDKDYFEAMQKRVNAYMSQAKLL